MSTDASTAQRKAINAILAKLGLMDDKAAIISDATNGRTTHSSEMTSGEARVLLMALDHKVKAAKKTPNPSQKMINKLFAIAHEMGWVKTITTVGKNGMETKKDYTTLHTWINTHGYLKKPLSQYSYNELPKLVHQLDKVYEYYISKL